MSETSQLTGPIRSALTEAGYPVIRIQCGKVKVRGGWMHLADEGTADLLVLLSRGQCLWVETKDPQGTTRKSRQEAQGRFRDRVVALGHLYVRAEHLDDVLEALKGK